MRKRKNKTYSYTLLIYLSKNFDYDDDFNYTIIIFDKYSLLPVPLDIRDKYSINKSNNKKPMYRRK